MSNKALDEIADDIINSWKVTGPKKAGDDAQARKDVLRLQIQVLVVKKEIFESILSNTFPELTNNKTVLDKLWNSYKVALEQVEQAQYSSASSKLGKVVKISNNTSLPQAQQEAIDKLRSAEALRDNFNTKANQYAILISTFDQTKQINANLKALVAKELGKNENDPSIGKLGGIGAADKEGKKFGGQWGHADSSTGGVAASSIRLLNIEATLDSLSSGKNIKEITELKNIINTYRRNLQLAVKHAQVLDTSGKLKKGYIVVVTLQEAWINQQQKSLEQAMITAVEDQLKNIENRRGSLTLIEALSSVTLENLASTKRKNKKVSGRHKKRENSKGKGKGRDSSTNKVVTKVSTSGGITSAALKGARPRKTRKSSSAKSMFGLAAIINQKLPDTVRKNMGTPGLENVTGRFAGSVRVTDISATAKGYPSIGYTYMRDPYQVFEVGVGGSAWASTERDPRKLIDRSIREIAADMAIGRFYTRRN